MVHQLIALAAVGEDLGLVPAPRPYIMSYNLFWTLWAGSVHMVHICACRENIHTQKIKRTLKIFWCYDRCFFNPNTKAQNQHISEFKASLYKQVAGQFKL